MRLGNWDPYASSDDDKKGGLSKVASLLLSFVTSTDPFVQAQLSGDVEVQEGFTLSQQIGIAMACLVDDDRMNLVEFVQEVRLS